MNLLKFMILTMTIVTSAFATNVDLKASSLQWEGKKVTGGHVGKIFYKTAKVDMKDGKLTGGEFVVDMSSFTVDDLQGEWATKFLNHMKSGDFFDVAKFPTSNLKIKSVANDKITADLTIKGKTNTVIIPYTKKGNTFSGKLTFDRTKFDMIYNSGNFFKDLGDKMINDEVNVDFKFVVKE